MLNIGHKQGQINECWMELERKSAPPRGRFSTVSYWQDKYRYRLNPDTPTLSALLNSPSERAIYELLSVASYKRTRKSTTVFTYFCEEM